MYERNSRSGLFLMEMIISILFFSITSAITVQLFVKAHNIAKITLKKLVKTSFEYIFVSSVLIFFLLKYIIVNIKL